MDKKFDLKFIEHTVDSQRNDCGGFVCIDGHEGLMNFREMCEDCGIDMSSYFIYGITLNDFEPIGMGSYGVGCEVYLIDENKYGHSFDEISNHDGTIELIRKSISVKYSDFHKYIKRLSVGVVTPISSQCNVTFHE